MCSLLLGDLFYGRYFLLPVFQLLRFIFVNLSLHSETVFYLGNNRIKTKQIQYKSIKADILYSYSGSSRVQSNPRTIRVTVLPHNDESPHVSINKLLNVWMGSATPLASRHLLTEDADSRPDELVYIIHRKPGNGFFSLTNRTFSQPIENFTQADVNLGLVSFIHTLGEIIIFG